MILLLFGLKEVSTVPSGYNLAIRLRVIPPTPVNVPATRMFPSACNLMSVTVLLRLGSKDRSRDLSVLSLAIRLRAIPPTVVKDHQMIIFPSACSLIATTAALGELSHGT